MQRGFLPGGQGSQARKIRQHGETILERPPDPIRPPQKEIYCLRDYWTGSLTVLGAIQTRRGFSPLLINTVVALNFQYI